VDNLNLTQAAPPLDPPALNYNAREVRVIDNPNTTLDRAVFTGAITGTIHNDLLKTGNGRLELNGNNAYQGATLVTEGTLVVNSSIQSSFLTHVRNLNPGGTATLAGRGTVGVLKVETGGIVAPGNALGNSSILNAGELTMGPGAKLSIELGGTTAGGDNTLGYDQVNVTGAVRIAGAELVGGFLGSFLQQVKIGDLFFVIRNDGSDEVDGAFLPGGLLGSGQFDISYTGDSETNQFLGGNDVVLRALIPEPSVAALAFAAFPLLVGRRRRR
jgi:autotransporter-associated beta strand protein